MHSPYTPHTRTNHTLVLNAIGLSLDPTGRTLVLVETYAALVKVGTAPQEDFTRFPYVGYGTSRRLHPFSLRTIGHMSFHS